MSTALPNSADPDIDDEQTWTEDPNYLDINAFLAKQRIESDPPQPTFTPSSTSATTAKDSSDLLLIIAIVVLSVLCLALAITIVTYVLISRRKRQQQQTDPEKGADGDGAEDSISEDTQPSETNAPPPVDNPVQESETYEVLPV